MPIIEANPKMLLVSAVALIDTDGRVLLTQRPAGKSMAGLWEFPGGKVEQGESVTEALIRELKEECNIAVTDCAPLTVVEHQYRDKRVLLDVWWVLSYTGTARQMEGQEFVWADIAQLDAYQFPDANQPIVDCLMDAQSH